MRKTTLLVSLAALALVGGCGKKKEASKKAPPPPPPAAVDASVANVPPPPPPKPVKLEGEALGKRFLECHGYFSSQDKDKFKDCYAKDATSRFADSMMPETKGADAILTNAMAFHAGFPDGKTEPQLVLVNGRNVASVVLFTGTNSAPLTMGPQSMPATNKKVGMNMLHLVTFDDENRVTDEWWFMDDATFGAQLGMPGAQGGRPVVEKGIEGAAPIVVATGNDTEKANLAAQQKGTEAFNAHDSKALLDAWADDAIESDMASPADVQGKKEVEKGVKMFLGAFPDAKLDTRTAWAAGDYVVGVYTFNATNKGKMGPMKPTNKPVTVAVAELAKLDGGKVKQLWRFYNMYAMMVQMGLAPDMSKMQGSGTGSAAGSGTGSGSAAGSASGSAAGSATGSAAGSATGSAAGSATGSAKGM